LSFRRPEVCSATDGEECDCKSGTAKDLAIYRKGIKEQATAWDKKAAGKMQRSLAKFMAKAVVTFSVKVQHLHENMHVKLEQTARNVKLIKESQRDVENQGWREKSFEIKNNRWIYLKESLS
jgi:hypothetical protein